MIDKTWLRTNDKDCHRPTFDIRCRYCDTAMFMRFSDVDIATARKDKTYINYVGYKCPNCAWVARFDVADTLDYLTEIVKLRKGISAFTPDSSEWVGEDEKKRQQLEALGYIGGR